MFRCQGETDPPCTGALGRRSLPFSPTNHTAALTSLPIFNFPGTSGTLLTFSGYRCWCCFSAFNYKGTFSCRKIPCPRQSVGCSDRNNHLRVISQRGAEGSGGRSATNKMDSIKNQFHSCCRNEQWKGKRKKKKEKKIKKRQFNSF